ncbi:hypothetical protein KBC04_05100 [Candidatus Babeliales bacterium]|nr:hypothetical protein [Candidatus Babeliales bacterium]MBP9844231.1 hypothetical protein [Candidatus Babeliales bacterium]
MKNSLNSLLLCFFVGVMIQADFLEQKNLVQKKQYVVGYNVPPLLYHQAHDDSDGRIHDVSFDVSFLYYYAAQDGLDLGNSAAVITSGASTGNVVATGNGIGLIQDFTYNPEDLRQAWEFIVMNGH